MRREHRDPVPGVHPVRFGTAELLADADWPGGWLLTVDGVAQSYVDLDDPTHLEFDYTRRMGDVIDCLPPGPLDCLHVGGAGCTLPRYVSATRPASTHLVLDADGELMDLVAAHLALDTVPDLRIRVADARSEITSVPPASVDLAVLDAFQAASTPSRLSTREFLVDVARTLRPHGVVLVNVSDGPGLVYVRRVLATIQAVLPTVLLLGEPAILKGRRFGNLVVAASAVDLPVDEVRDTQSRAPFPARCVTGPALTALIDDAPPLTDAAPASSPAPPAGLF